MVHEGCPGDRRRHRVTVEVLHIADGDIDGLLVDFIVLVEDVDNQELAEMLAFNTLHLQSYASEIAFRWIATDETYKKICGYAILGRMFTNGSIPDARGINELIDQASVALRDENAGVRHAAYNCLIKFADVDEECGDIVKKSMNNSGIEDFL